MSAGRAGNPVAGGRGVAEAVRLVVAGGAGDRVVTGQPLVVKQHAPERRAQVGDLVVHRRVVLGDMGGDGLVRVVRGVRQVDDLFLGGNGGRVKKDEDDGVHGGGGIGTKLAWPC